MKNIVRAFVAVLVLTGAAASTYATPTATSSSKIATISSAMPVPTCPPGGEDGCGIMRPR